MDSRAQVSFEYLIIIAILILVSALLLVFSSSLFSNKEGIKNSISSYKEKLTGMLG